MYGDFETYVKESGQWSEAVAVINKAILQQIRRNLNAQNDYLEKFQHCVRHCFLLVKIDDIPSGGT